MTNEDDLKAFRAMIALPGIIRLINCMKTISDNDLIKDEITNLMLGVTIDITLDEIKSTTPLSQEEFELLQGINSRLKGFLDSYENQFVPKTDQTTGA